ncbi:MAG TPA: DNA alkylation repair protein [Dehalococcoidia bacterium]
MADRAYPTAEDLAREIEVRVRALASPDTASIRRLRREYSKRLRVAPPRLVVDVALELWRGGDVARRQGAVHRFFGDELIVEHPMALSLIGPEEIVALGEGLSSWDQVDCFALYLAGRAWRRGQISDELVMSWAASQDRWWRRAALVSTVPLNAKAQGGSGDTPRTLALCALLVDDRDDMVVKAMSWALRVLSQRDAAAVRSFADANRERLASRVVREVEHKLWTGLKNPRRQQPPRVSSD